MNSVIALIAAGASLKSLTGYYMYA